MVIHQTLYNLFPPTSFHTPSIAPFTPTEFIQRILVPEAALRLIMEDTGQSPDEAIKTMRESAAYGVTMFPDGRVGGKYGDDVDGDVDGDADGGVGEDIVMERARARRAEVEVEDRVEERVLKEMGMFEDGVGGGAGKKGKAIGKGIVSRPPKSAGTSASGARGKKRKKGDEPESAIEAAVSMGRAVASKDSAPNSSAPRPPKPRPIPVAKRQRPTETTDVSGSEFDHAKESDASAATTASRRSRKPSPTTKESTPPPPQPPRRSVRARSVYTDLSSADESEDGSSTLVPSSHRSIELSKTSDRSKSRAVTDSSEVEIIENFAANAQTPKAKGPPRPRMIKKNLTLTEKDINGARVSPEEETPKAGRLGEPSKTYHPLMAARRRTAKNEYVK